MEKTQKEIERQLEELRNSVESRIKSNTGPDLVVAILCKKIEALEKDLNKLKK